MSNNIAISIELVKTEFDRTVGDVARQVMIYSRRSNLKPIDPIVFVKKYFVISDGQKYVQYEDDPDPDTIEGKLLLNYPKAPRQRVVVVSEPPKVEKPIVVTPFCVEGPVELQVISVASSDAQYDLAVQVEGLRRVETVSLNGALYALERWDNGYLDVINGPDNINKKPFCYRRDFLKKFDVKVVPETNDLTTAILIQDSKPYVPGESSGYAKITLNRELSVVKQVKNNETTLLVRGSLASNNQYTQIKTYPSPDSNPGKSFALVNLDSMETIRTTEFAHDVKDYYNVMHALPAKYSDVKLSKKNDNITVVPVNVFLEGRVQGKGVRNRLYSMFYGSRVKIKIQNVEDGVSIRGDVEYEHYSVFRYKLDIFAYNNHAVVRWKGDPIADRQVLENIQWDVTILY